MALSDLEVKEAQKPSLVCQVVGDGSFMCAAPSSALWVARKYEIPILTVVLNNGGKSTFHPLLSFFPTFWCLPGPESRHPHYHLTVH